MLTLAMIARKSESMAKSLDYTHRPFEDQLSRLGIRQFELDIFADGGPGGGDTDTRTSATIRYTRDLNRDWDLNAGLRVRRVDDSGSDAISSNTLFVNIGRDFSFGF